jgi:aerobic-type carbon monoxide dehydrogenase small subunit (CoxS/CutS family)
MSVRRQIRLTVNGEMRELEVEPRLLLTDALRSGLGLTGTHVGCEQGSCGACTVIVDGRAQRSCLMLAVQADGAEIETVEGLHADHEVQRTMREEHGLQCGFCTPGIVMSLVAAHRAELDREAARTEVLGGHLCRCTGYVNIRAAIDSAWDGIGDDR